MGDIEEGQCQFCKKIGPIERTYLHGCEQIEGECDGFIIVYHCHEHKPVEVKHSQELETALKNLLQATDDVGWCNGEDGDWEEQAEARKVLGQLEK